MRRAVALFLIPLAATSTACERDREAEPTDGPVVMPGASPFAYPHDLWDLEVEGETVLMVHVTEAGAVDTAYVHESSGFPAFDSVALAGAGRLRFSPGRQGQKRVAMWTRLPVRFARDTTPGVGLAAPPFESRHE
jgi:TonB family protein